MGTKLLSNEQWNKKMDKLFEIHVGNNDGFLTLDKFLTYHCIKQTQAMKSNEETKYNLAVAITSFACGIGLLPGEKLDKNQFKVGVAKLAAKEEIRKKAGIPTLMDGAMDAFLDLLEQSRDMVTEDDLEVLLNNTGIFEEDAAQRTMEGMDKKDDGAVSRAEMKEKTFLLWYTDDIENVQGMYGITID